MPTTRRSGFSLIELLMVLVLIGILAGLAAPSMRGLVDLRRAHGALDMVAADIAYARMLAVQRGERIEIVFDSTGGQLSGTYRIRTLDPAAPPLKRVNLEVAAGALSMSNQSHPLRFNSRGLLTQVTNRSVVINVRQRSDTLTVSALGRVYRKY